MRRVRKHPAAGEPRTAVKPAASEPALEPIQASGQAGKARMLNMEQAIGEIAARIMEMVQDKTVKKPLLVAVYGIPNSGKSYLKDRIRERLQDRGILISGGEGQTDVEPMRTVKRALEDCGQADNAVYFFHEPGYYRLRWPSTEPTYPDQVTKAVFGRETDLNICITNPKHEEMPVLAVRLLDRNFDFVVFNFDSVVKRQPR